jgi:hypothetical protein
MHNTRSIKENWCCFKRFFNVEPGILLLILDKLKFDIIIRTLKLVIWDIQKSIGSTACSLYSWGITTPTHGLIPLVCGICPHSYNIDLCCFVDRSLFALFLLTIVLSVLRYTPLISPLIIIINKHFYASVHTGTIYRGFY